MQSFLFSVLFAFGGVFRGDGQASMARIQLEVQFHDILMKDKELAVQLCNAQGSNEFWLRQAANEFFTESGVSTTGPVSFHFKDMPIRCCIDTLVLLFIYYLYTNMNDTHLLYL